MILFPIVLLHFSCFGRGAAGLRVDTLDRLTKPVCLSLQSTVCGLRIESGIDARRQTPMVQHGLNHGQVLALNRPIARAGPPEIVQAYTAHVPSTSNQTPHLVGAGFRPGAPFTRVLTKAQMPPCGIRAGDELHSNRPIVERLEIGHGMVGMTRSLSESCVLQSHFRTSLRVTEFAGWLAQCCQNVRYMRSKFCRPRRFPK